MLPYFEILCLKKVTILMLTGAGGVLEPVSTYSTVALYKHGIHGEF